MPVSPPVAFSTVKATVAQRAEDSSPNRPKRTEAGCLFGECADEHRGDGAASRRAAHGAEDDSDIERDRSTIEDLQRQLSACATAPQGPEK